MSGALGRGLNFHLGKKAEKISRVVETASSETGSESVLRPALALEYCVSLALLSDVGNIRCKDTGPRRGLCSLCHTQFPVSFGMFCSHCKPHGKGGCSLDQGIIWSDQANAKFSRPLQGPLSLSLAPALPRLLVQSLFCCLFSSFLSLPWMNEHSSLVSSSLALSRPCALVCTQSHPQTCPEAHGVSLL